MEAKANWISGLGDLWVTGMITRLSPLFKKGFEDAAVPIVHRWRLARSGGVFYGGLILAVIVAFWYIDRYRLPFWTTCDIFAPGIALGHVTGRLGCLAAGCCYGSPTDVPWAITFTNPLAAANVGTPLGIALHPTQVYEAGAELLILGLLL